MEISYIKRVLAILVITIYTGGESNHHSHIGQKSSALQKLQPQKVKAGVKIPDLTSLIGLWPAKQET